MRRDGWKWALAGGAIALLIVYGLDSADSGIENVYGPVGEGAQTHAVNENFEPLQNGQTDVRSNAAQKGEGSVEAGTVSGRTKQQETVQRDAQPYTPEERLPGVPYDTSEPAVNKLADGAAGVLQSVSSGGIKLFVSVFDGIMD
ncbi:hypothetical protein [Paenibacillus kobensis]|uniref:hypothetical protein n=1 Tax=Paenibacillus kobensis TaxID=59841 RepID=UPI000FD79E6A|nr:hypothetical protein [Paenibacillus kobensis]